MSFKDVKYGAIDLWTIADHACSCNLCKWLMEVDRVKMANLLIKLEGINPLVEIRGGNG